MLSVVFAVAASLAYGTSDTFLPACAQFEPGRAGEESRASSLRCPGARLRAQYCWCRDRARCHTGERRFECRRGGDSGGAASACSGCRMPPIERFCGRSASADACKRRYRAGLGFGPRCCSARCTCFRRTARCRQHLPHIRIARGKLGGSGCAARALPSCDSRACANRPRRDTRAPSDTWRRVSALRCCAAGSVTLGGCTAQLRSRCAALTGAPRARIGQPAGRRDPRPVRFSGEGRSRGFCRGGAGRSRGSRYARGGSHGRARGRARDMRRAKRCFAHGA